MIVSGWIRDYFISPRDAAIGREIVLNSLKYGFSRDGIETTFDANSFTSVVSELRYKGKKMPGGYGDQRRVLEALGFKIVRARPEFSYRPGKFRAECDCVIPDPAFDPDRWNEFSIEEATFLVSAATKAMRRVVRKSYRVPSPRLRRGVGSY